MSRSQSLTLSDVCWLPENNGGMIVSRPIISSTAVRPMINGQLNTVRGSVFTLGVEKTRQLINPCRSDVVKCEEKKQSLLPSCVEDLEEPSRRRTEDQWPRRGDRRGFPTGDESRLERSATGGGSGDRWRPDAIGG